MNKRVEFKFSLGVKKGRAVKGFISDLPTPVFVPQSWVKGTNVRIPEDCMVDKVYQAARPVGYWEPRKQKANTTVQRFYVGDDSSEFVEYRTWIPKGRYYTENKLFVMGEDQEKVKKGLIDAIGIDDFQAAAQRLFVETGKMVSPEAREIMKSHFFEN